MHDYGNRLMAVGDVAETALDDLQTLAEEIRTAERGGIALARSLPRSIDPAALRATALAGDIEPPLRVEPDTERLGLWRVVEVDEETNNPLVCGGCTRLQAAYIAAFHPGVTLALLDKAAAYDALVVEHERVTAHLEMERKYRWDFEAERNALVVERDRLREQVAQHCACTHDGRGELTSECQEHEDIRAERDALDARVAGLEAQHRAAVEALEQLAGIAGRMWHDIKDWTHTARGLRERSVDPNHDPSCPHQRGIDESERICDEAAPVFKAVDAILTPASPDTAPVGEAWRPIDDPRDDQDRRCDDCLGSGNAYDCHGNNVTGVCPTCKGTGIKPLIPPSLDPATCRKQGHGRVACERCGAEYVDVAAARVSSLRQ